VATGLISRVEQHKMRQMCEGEMVRTCRVFRPQTTPVGSGGAEAPPRLVYEGKCGWVPRPLLGTESLGGAVPIERSVVVHDFTFPVTVETERRPRDRIAAQDYIEVEAEQRRFEVVVNRGLDMYEIQVLVDATEQRQPAP